MGVLRPDEGVIHGAAQVRCHGVPIQMLRRAATVLGQLTAHSGLGDVLARQKPPRRAAVGLQHGKQQMPGVCLTAAKTTGQLYCLLQQLLRLPREPSVSAKAQFFPNAHLRAPCCSVKSYRSSSIAQMHRKKSVVCVEQPLLPRSA